MSCERCNGDLARKGGMQPNRAAVVLGVDRVSAPNDCKLRKPLFLFSRKACINRERDDPVVIRITLCATT